MRRRSRGFTVIELLVVVALIAILAAILFPVLVAAKEKAHQTTCANNMRQITTALVSYADDWDGCLPGLNVFGDLVEVTDEPLNKGPLWRYVKSNDVFCCPVEKKHKKAGGIRFTYTMNGYMTYAEQDREKADLIGVLVSKSRNSTRTILLVGENTDVSKIDGAINDALFIWNDATCDRHPLMNMQRFRGSRGSANVCYLDTHIGIAPGLLVWNTKEGRELFYR